MRSDSEMRLDLRVLTKAVLLFLGIFVVYFLLRSPGLDDYDSVLFALGVRQFNLWIDQPHPPGYPIFIFLGWIGDSVFNLGPEFTLHLVAAFGGALFVAVWFLIVRLQFNERFAWLVGVSLALTPAVWMTATKVLTDSLAAGLLSAEILAALIFLRGGGRRSLALAATLGAAAVGTRPQLVLVALAVLLTALRTRAAVGRVWALGLCVFVAASLVWLIPTCYLQARWHPEISVWSAYPELLYQQWQYRLDKPQVSLLAGGWSLRYFAIRFGSHIFGWFGLGFGLLENWSIFLLGTVLVGAGLFMYLRRGRAASDANFWRFHAPWALLHIVIIFVCLPAAQRYYLMIFPLLLVAVLSGLRGLPQPWNKAVLALPALFIAVLIPTAPANHGEQSPPVRLIDYLKNLYPFEQRGRVLLILNTAQRHAEWYAPEFRRIHPAPKQPIVAEVTRGALAVYTDDAKLPLPAGWRRIPVAVFARSYIIYMKYHEVHLFRIERGQPW